MAIPTTIASLSTNAALNGPDGATDLPSVLDDGLRYAYSFIAQLRDGQGFSATSKLVTVGGDSTAVTFGYSTALSKYVVSRDGAAVTNVVPMDISGNAATATTATNAGTVGGLAQTNFLRNTDPTQGIVGFRYSAGLLVPYVNGTEFGAVWPIQVAWGNIIGRPTDLASFSNSPGYAARYGNNFFDVGGPDGSGNLGRAIPNTDNRIGYIKGASGALVVRLDGFEWAWAVNLSDARLKRDIAPTEEDSLAKVMRIDFKRFTFNDRVPSIDGITRKLGALAQDLEQIEPEFTLQVGEFKQLNIEGLLMAALHSVAQLGARVAELEAR